MIAVAAGVLWTYITGGGFNMVLVGLKVFPIVIIGGLDSIGGVLVGAMLIGWIEALAAGYLDPIIGGGFSHVTSYLLLIAMLLVRPWGLFGREGHRPALAGVAVPAGAGKCDAAGRDRGPRSGERVKRPRRE